MHSTALLFFTSPLALALTLPPRAEPCDAARQWTIPNVDYSSQITYSTPAHMATSRASIEFTYTSSTNSETSSCTGYSTGQQDSGAFFAFPNPTGCTEAPGSATVSTFSYTGPTKNLNINETFTCEGNTYLAAASTQLALQCKETVYNNPNWTTPGDIYSAKTVACEPLSVILTPHIFKLG
ncbi:hypothetical protein DM02DRAFT_188542 [Periconia macrospinosa]|uniref:Uncharacterized protein n=1 Tax=Periconia macrospinosa TaxID=97972 RepID=A0A2V1D8V2_9PLEO|nr:hypothetical protein DM02DRAFT_188542 [Periconia macrospinosa]